MGLIGAMRTQLSNLVWASIQNAMNPKVNVWDAMKQLEERQAAQLDRAMNLAIRMYQMTKDPKFLDKLDKILAKQDNLRMANNNRELRQLYREVREAIKEMKKNHAQKSKPQASMSNLQAPIMSISPQAYKSYAELQGKLERELKQNIEKIRQDIQKAKENLQRSVNLANKVEKEAKQGVERWAEQKEAVRTEIKALEADRGLSR